MFSMVSTRTEMAAKIVCYHKNISFYIKGLTCLSFLPKIPSHNFNCSYALLMKNSASYLIFAEVSANISVLENNDRNKMSIIHFGISPSMFLF